MSRLQAAVFQVLEDFTLSDDVRKILEAAYHSDDTFAQGRAAGLEEAAKWIDARLGNFMSQYGYDDSETGALEFGRGAQADAKREYVGELEEIAEGIRALSPTSSDAGKADARDAARYRWIAEQGSLRDEFRSPDFARVCQFFNDLGGQLLGNAIDEAMGRAALSSLEVIGKGEKG